MILGHLGTFSASLTPPGPPESQFLGFAWPPVSQKLGWSWDFLKILILRTLARHWVRGWNLHQSTRRLKLGRKCSPTFWPNFSSRRSYGPKPWFLTHFCEKSESWAKNQVLGHNFVSTKKLGQKHGEHVRPDLERWVDWWSFQALTQRLAKVTKIKIF